VVTAAEVQSQGVEQTSSAVLEINASIRGVGESVDRLSLSASGSSSSILEMAASIEEVALNVETLSRTVEEVGSSILQMTASIKQVGGSAATLMDASTTTASSIEEMDSAIKEVERNAIETVAIADEVRRDAESGRNAVEATIVGMNEIRESSRVTATVIETLSTRVGDIGTILSVIDEVAEQTNLLALNAAIIAAQAGEHGKGFAVVADEIKDLAERTSSSTREITEVIRGVQDETQRAVEVIDQTEQRIAKGELLTNKAGEALNKIVAGISRSNSQMGVIARATSEQSRGSQMIRDAMLRVSEMVAQIATATREQGRSSDQIMGAAEKMKRLTAQVRSSTREQSNAGKFIARSTEDITSMIQEIKSACDEQTHGSDQIVSAVEHMQRSANLNLKATQVLRESLGVLSRHTTALQQEMGGFRVSASASSGGTHHPNRMPQQAPLVLETAAR
jgi:methyl-accepting chemotaxis protein